jgi:hypothetical protein
MEMSFEEIIPEEAELKEIRTGRGLSSETLTYRFYFYKPEKNVYNIIDLAVTVYYSGDILYKVELERKDETGIVSKTVLPSELSIILDIVKRYGYKIAWVPE